MECSRGTRTDGDGPVDCEEEDEGSEGETVRWGWSKGEMVMIRDRCGFQQVAVV